MRRILSRGIQTLELVRPGAPVPVDESVALRDRAQAVALLRAFSRDPMNMATLRRALGEEIGHHRVSRLGDTEVIQQVAAHLSRGRFHVAPLASSRTVVRPRRIHDWTTRTEKVTKEEPVVKESPTGPPPAPEESTRIDFSTDVDEDLVLGFETEVEEDLVLGFETGVGDEVAQHSTSEATSTGA